MMITQMSYYLQKISVIPRDQLNVIHLQRMALVISMKTLKIPFRQGRGKTSTVVGFTKWEPKATLASLMNTVN